MCQHLCNKEGSNNSNVIQYKFTNCILRNNFNQHPPGGVVIPFSLTLGCIILLRCLMSLPLCLPSIFGNS